MTTPAGFQPLLRISLACTKNSNPKNYPGTCRWSFPFYELNPKIRPDLENVYYDLAACPLLYDPSLYRQLLDAVGYQKIIWELITHFV